MRKRNRIVIDFNQPKVPRASWAGGSSRSSGIGSAGRVLIAIAVTLFLIVVGVIAGGYFWWRSFQSTPAYSLALLAYAAQQNDTAGVDTILDSDKVTDDFVAQVRQRTSGSYATTVNSLLSNQTTSAAAALSPQLKQTVHDQVVREIQRITEPAAGKPFVLIALAMPRFAEIKQDQQIARADVHVKDERVQLTLQPAEGHWRVVAIQDDKIAQIIADSIRRNLSNSGTQIQDEIRKQLDKLQNRQR
jgi:hypothetical protein